MTEEIRMYARSDSDETSPSAEAARADKAEREDEEEEIVSHIEAEVVEAVIVFEPLPE